MRWGSLRAGSPTGRQSGFIRQNYGRPDRRGEKGLTAPSTRPKKPPQKPPPFLPDHMEQERSYFWARWEETCRPQFEFHLCEGTVSKMHLPGMHPVWVFIPFHFAETCLLPVKISFRGRQAVFVFMLTYSVSNTAARLLQNPIPCVWFPSSEGKRLQPGLLGVGWGNSWEPSSGSDTRPLLGGSSGSRFHMETMFVFTKHFRGKISPIRAEEAGYPYGLQLPVNMRQNNDSRSLKTSILIDFLALLWHPVLLIDNCRTERKPKSFLFRW